jgi:hypothetical protein
MNCIFEVFNGAGTQRCDTDARVTWSLETAE